MRSRRAGSMRDVCRTEATPLADKTEDRSVLDVWAFWLGLGLLMLGVACRLYVYLLAFPIWRDEAALALNFVSRDFHGLLDELDNFQVAPLLFLWIEKAVYQCLGGSAALLRLLPLLAGVAGLELFWRLARRCLTPLPAALAVGFLAVAQSPIQLASMVKPYSLDLFAATLLLTLAVRYLRTPDRIGALAALTLLIPVIVTASYPAIFVSGAVSMVLLPVAWRRGGRGWYIAFNVLCGASFAAHVRFVGHAGHDPTLPTVQAYMADFWKGGFPPHEPLTALHWLIRCHTGHLFSYPLAFNGGGLLGLLLAVFGGRALYRQRQLGLLGLCLLPFVLNFVAAVLHRYPYAGDQRLEQHLVPSLCLLLGSGGAELIRKLPAGADGRRRWAMAAAGLLVLIALAGAVTDTLHPAHDVEASWAEDIARHLRREIRPRDRLLLSQPERFTLNCIRWQLLPFAEQMCSAEIDWPGLERTGGRLWLVHQMLERAPAGQEFFPYDARPISLSRDGNVWNTVRRTRFVVREPGGGEQQVFHYCCDLHVLERGNSQARGGQSQLMQERAGVTRMAVGLSIAHFDECCGRVAARVTRRPLTRR